MGSKENSLIDESAREAGIVRFLIAELPKMECRTSSLVAKQGVLRRELMLRLRK
jgi:hypothetical protein